MSAENGEAHEAAATASTERLRELAASPLEGVRCAVASNPNAPIEALSALLEEFTEEVLANPALAMHLLADPGALSSLSLEAAMALTGCPAAPASILDHLASTSPWDYKAQRAARAARSGGITATRNAMGALYGRWLGNLGGNASTPPERLFHLALSASPWARAGVAANPSAPPELVDLLLRAGSSRSLLRCSDAHGPLSDSERTQLMEGGHWGRVLVAAHRDTPEDVRGRLVSLLGADPKAGGSVDFSDEYAEKRELARALLRSPCVTSHEIVKLGELFERYRYVAGGLTDEEAEAISPATPPERLRQLAAYADEWLKTLIGSNPSTPGEVLLQLAIEHEVAALENPALERALQEEPELLSDLSPIELGSLADHSAAPPGLAALRSARGEDAHPADEYAPSAEALLEQATCEQEHLRRDALEHPRMPHAWRRLLARAARGAPPLLTEEELEWLLSAGPWGRELAQRNRSFHGLPEPQEAPDPPAEADEWSEASRWILSEDGPLGRDPF